MSGSGGKNKASRGFMPKAQLPTPEGSPSPTAPNKVFHGLDTPEVIKLSKSKGDAVLHKAYVLLNGMYFPNETAADNAMAQSQWHPPMNDDTIPKNDKEDRRVVERLVAAFKNLSHALDSEDNAYRKRFTVGHSVTYSDWTIERCAWEVLNVTKNIHIEGFKAPIFDEAILKAIGQTEDWTFDERISMICRVLENVAVTLMKYEKTWTIIGAPHKLLNSSIVNAASNAKRNKWVRAGREADLNHSGPSRKRPRTENAVNSPSPLRNESSEPDDMSPTPATDSSPSSLSSPTDLVNTDIEMVDPGDNTGTASQVANFQGIIHRGNNFEGDIKINLEDSGEVEKNTTAGIKDKNNGKAEVKTTPKTSPKNDATMTDTADTADTADTDTTPPRALSLSPPAAPAVAKVVATTSLDYEGAHILLGLRAS